MDLPSPVDNCMTSSRSSSSMNDVEMTCDGDYDEEFPDEQKTNRDSHSTSPDAADTALPKNYLYPRKEFVEELRPEEVRWFYRVEHDKKWTPFIGYDSLRIECKYREMMRGAGEVEKPAFELILVREGLYEADLSTQKCHSVYWSGKCMQWRTPVLAMPRPSLAKFHPHFGHVGIDRSLNSLTIKFQKTIQLCPPISSKAPPIPRSCWDRSISEPSDYEFPENYTGDVLEILRGIWFYDSTWHPVDESYAVQIEAEHMAHFMGKPLDEKPIAMPKGPKPVLHRVKFSDFYIDWNSADDIYMFSDSKSSRLVRHVGKSLGFQTSGTRMRRGYCYEAVMDNKPPDIGHLVFVVHGIGQKMETGSIVRCCKELRENVEAAKKKRFPKFNSSNTRAEFLPVEWRSSLSLDGDVVETVTPRKMRMLRNMLNSSVMDILYYTSPIYRSEITIGLLRELNRLYRMFCDRNPFFEAAGGKVSLIGHSLGSVISYDIITGWNPIKMYDQFLSSVIEEEASRAVGQTELLSELDKARTRVHELETSLLSIIDQLAERAPALTFQVENMFCIGSPLAVFLALRGVRPDGSGTQDHIMPKHLCKRIFNVFHPADPIAYRIEPLILKHYASIKPLPVHRTDSTTLVPYADMKNRVYKPQHKAEPKVETGATEASTDTVDGGVQFQTSRFSLSGMISRFSKKASNSPLTTEMKIRYKQEGQTSAAAPSATVAPMPATRTEMQVLERLEKFMEGMNSDCQVILPEDTIEKTEMEHRIDYQLRETSFENQYISVVTSHTSYWANHDVALFMLLHLHPNLQSDS